MNIAIGQINSTIGDFAGNQEKIRVFTERAKACGADMVLFPELAVCGYPPMDLLDQDRFVELNLRTVHVLQRELPADIAVGIGFVGRNPYSGGKSLVNEYGIILNGKLAFTQLKTLLPTYDIFDEARNFEPCREWKAFEYKGERIGIAICEDVWRETHIPGTHYIHDPVQEILNQGVTILLAPSASPYVAGKLKVRRELAARISMRGNVPFVYINAVGANDSILFDGQSFIIAPTPGAEFKDDKKNYTPRLLAKPFAEDLVIWDSKETTVNFQYPYNTPYYEAKPFNVDLTRRELDTLEQALVMGIRDYMAKCGYTKAHLALLGDMDSALLAYLAVKAAGKENVLCFSLPSEIPGNRNAPLYLAAELADKLGCRHEEIDMAPMLASFHSGLGKIIEQKPLQEENLLSLIRGSLLMVYSNRADSLLLSPEDKSALATGLCILMNGELSPIGDMFKTEVFALCSRINERSENEQGKALFPKALLETAPSTELFSSYDALDEILRLYLYDNLCKDEIVEKGWGEDLTARIISATAKAEFKRHQAPPVLKVSPRAFGIGRRMPIARSIYEG